jgi:hypothetical protein
MNGNHIRLVARGVALLLVWALRRDARQAEEAADVDT